MQKPVLVLLTAAAILAIASSLAYAGSHRFVLVVHSNNEIESISKGDASDIFLKRMQTWKDGSEIEVVDQHIESKLRAHFSTSIHGRSVSAIKSHWHKLIFTGRGLPPAELASDAEVIEFVGSHPRAIGYVSSRAQIGNLKVLRLEP
ncbi:MAG: hypothetical protein GY944_09220 [bacterium]|nr:hypothetical protein [bacterium]